MKSYVNTITENTTLGELLVIMGPFPPKGKTPTVSALQKKAGEPIALTERCAVYANGYAVYENDCGRTVLWLPSCTSFLYCFNPLKETEKGQGIEESCAIPASFLSLQPWPLVVMLVGEHRIEGNMMNRTGSRSGTTDFDSDDDGDKDGDVEEAWEESYRKAFSWPEEQFGESPENAYLRKEQLREILRSLTPKQNQAFTLYYYYGYKQREIAEILGIARSTVVHRLSCALAKAKKILI